MGAPHCFPPGLQQAQLRLVRSYQQGQSTQYSVKQEVRATKYLLLFLPGIRFTVHLVNMDLGPWTLGFMVKVLVHFPFCIAPPGFFPGFLFGFFLAARVDAARARTSRTRASLMLGLGRETGAASSGPQGLYPGQVAGQVASRPLILAVDQTSPSMESRVLV